MSMKCISNVTLNLQTQIDDAKIFKLNVEVFFVKLFNFYYLFEIWKSNGHNYVDENLG